MEFYRIMIETALWFLTFVKNHNNKTKKILGFHFSI